MTANWRVESAHSRTELETLLNTMDADGYYVSFVLTEASRDGFDFTVIAKLRRPEAATSATKAGVARASMTV